VAAGHAGTDHGAGSTGAKTTTRLCTSGSVGGGAGGGCPPCPRGGLAGSPGACPQCRPSRLPPLHQALPSSSPSSSVAPTHRPPPPAMHRVDIARSGRHGPGSPSPVATARGGSDLAGRARARRGGRPCAASSLPFVGGGARGSASSSCRPRRTSRRHCQLHTRRPHHQPTQGTDPDPLFLSLCLLDSMSNRGNFAGLLLIVEKSVDINKGH
jgi:hypothetical protein